MRPPFFAQTFSLLIASALIISASAQTPAPLTRPRRVQTNASDERAPTPAQDQITNTRLPVELTIRVGLATNAGAVMISTSGQLLNATNEDAVPLPLSVARVRVEPRVFAPLPAPTSPQQQIFRVEIASLMSRDEAERIAGDMRDLTNEAAEMTRDAATNTWRVRVGSLSSRAEAEELRSRLEEAGLASVSVVSNATPTTVPSLAGKTAVRASSTAPLDKAKVAAVPLSQTPATATPLDRSTRTTKSVGLRRASHVTMPTRGIAVYASRGAPLLDARAPVVFASDDEQHAPLRFNEKAYRGRIEVFTNLQGALTVVNVIGLEDYVRGVVPNELSPGGYPALEALKAQAVAARTYAVSHRGQFTSLGFDLLPTTRSQVYGGLSTEHPLASRAVEETRGVIATYHGQPIDALYTSTCGGRTEDAENIFGGETVPYLRGRECDTEEEHSFYAPFTIKTARDPFDLREAGHDESAREAALLAVHGFKSPARVTDEWLSSGVSIADARALLEAVARLSHRNAPVVNVDTTHAPGFSTALALALDGESRADVLLDQADVAYLLDFRDAQDIPARNRADVALMLRDGHLTLYPDATLRPRQTLSHAQALHAVAHLLEARGLFSFQRATTRPSTNNILLIRAGKSPERTLLISPDAYLFRAFGERLYQMRAVNLVGGEPIVYHTNAQGAADYVEVRPAPNGAAAERFSPFTNWNATLSAAEITNRLSRSSGRIGSIIDLRVATRGVSRRVLDLEIIGTNGTAHLRGGRIRSALGLREQLFVVDRRLDETGRVIAFTFTGRGWGHGVGLCQVGAYGLARAGWSYDKILRHYYTGIELTNLY